METRVVCGELPGVLDLETFLGGMETCRRRPRSNHRSALKPSLVEWKPIQSDAGIEERIDLETFLGGMETSMGIGDSLPWSILETFLGGMETGALHRPQLDDKGLETFLGGMETGSVGGDLRPLHPLKPSLVEWKPRPNRSREVIVCAP